MSRTPLMPKATAVWLVDNTSLTFDQIADFCGLHGLEVKGIADGDVAQGIKGADPISSGQLTREEIKKAQADPNYRLKMAEPKVEIPKVKTKRGPRYTPVSRRQDRPNAILWLVKYHPELKDSQIMRLVGTTKPTIQAIRDRTHWNSANLQPQDPVTLGLCAQTELDAAVKKAAARLEKEGAESGSAAEGGGTLLPAEETTSGLMANLPIGAPAPLTDASGREEAAKDAANESADVDTVFANFPNAGEEEQGEGATEGDKQE